MAGFTDWNQYDRFSSYVRRKGRYVLDSENQQFIEAISPMPSNQLISPEKGHLKNTGEVQRRQRLGGLLNYYYRAAA